jgi:hypothetical protein
MAPRVRNIYQYSKEYSQNLKKSRKNEKYQNLRIFVKIKENQIYFLKNIRLKTKKNIFPCFLWSENQNPFT